MQLQLCRNTKNSTRGDDRQRNWSPQGTVSSIIHSDAQCQQSSLQKTAEPHTQCLGNTGNESQRGWFRLITKGKKHSALPQALRAAEPGFSCEPQTPLMRLVINNGLVREGGADHWPLNKTTSHALGSDHKSRQSMSNSIFHLSFLLFFTFHYPQQSHVTSKECGLIPRECVSLQLRVGNS